MVHKPSSSSYNIHQNNLTFLQFLKVCKAGRDGADKRVKSVEGQ
ncbi:hypothetical protein V5J35_002655 [Endozoicomonas sp. NE40]|uniref:Uncharacterized protein n=1 Tax=Endozoicomonas lisbonensis TaxID=3120522 RepID=A0ABV2SI84_9GAMM